MTNKYPDGMTRRPSLNELKAFIHFMYITTGNDIYNPEHYISTACVPDGGVDASLYYAFQAGLAARDNTRDEMERRKIAAMRMFDKATEELKAERALYFPVWDKACAKFNESCASMRIEVHDYRDTNATEDDKPGILSLFRTHDGKLVPSVDGNPVNNVTSVTFTNAVGEVPTATITFTNVEIEPN